MDVGCDAISSIVLEVGILLGKALVAAPLPRFGVCALDRRRRRWPADGTDLRVAGLEDGKQGAIHGVHGAIGAKQNAIGARQSAIGAAQDAIGVRVSRQCGRYGVTGMGGTHISAQRTRVDMGHPVGLWSNLPVGGYANLGSRMRDLYPEIKAGDFWA